MARYRPKLNHNLLHLLLLRGKNKEKKASSNLPHCIPTTLNSLLFYPAKDDITILSFPTRK